MNPELRSFPRLSRRVRALVALGLVASVPVIACGGSSDGSDFGNGSGNGNGNGNGLGGDGNGNGGNGSLGGNGGNGGPGDLDAACASTSSKGQQEPLDIFIMLDQSQSMSESVSGGSDKWTAVTSALNTFVSTPQQGVSVGLQYFGLPPGGGGGAQCVAGDPCQSDADCNGGTCRSSGVCRCSGGGGGGNFNDSCSAADYSTADVEIAPLPGVAAQISASIGKHGPTTSTPTAPALQGAIQHASTWSKAHPNDVTIVVFATDGEPTECDPQDIGSIAQIAAAGVSGNPKILTFVIGVGSSTSNLDAIAKGGGTGNAFIVDTTQNVNQQFLDALNKIRGTALGCNYTIPVPQNGTPNFANVNVQYTPGNGGPVQTFPKVNDKSQCPASGGAWYYDNNSAPTHIVLCDAACTSVLADKSGEVDVLLGCASVIN